MNNTTPNTKMAARTHRKGFTPLPRDGWSKTWGTWEDYIEWCAHRGARVKTQCNGFNEYIEWRNDNGQIHREDGPAVECSDGYKSWYNNGHLHRLDGPAIEGPDGTRKFYKDDIRYTDITFTQRYWR